MKNQRHCYIFYAAGFILFFPSVIQTMKRPHPISIQKPTLAAQSQPLIAEAFLGHPMRVIYSNEQLMSLPQWKIEQIKVMLTTLKTVMVVPKLKPCKQEHKSPIFTLAYSPVENVVLSGGTSMCTSLENCYNNLFLWDTDYSTVEKEFCSGQCDIHAIAFSPDGTRFVTGGWGRGGSNTLILWNRKTGEKINLDGHNQAVNAVAFSRDGKKIVSGGAGRQNNLFVWDAQTGKVIYNLEGHDDSVNTVVFCPSDDNLVASGGDGEFNNLFLWDINRGEEVAALAGHTDSVNTVAFRPDGLALVSGSAGSKHNLLLWNTDTLIHKELPGHTKSVNAVLFSNDSKKIVSASDGNSNNLCIWNGAGKFLYNLSGHNASVKSLAFNHQQQNKLMLASGAENVCVWDLQSGQKIYTLAHHQKTINAILFSPDDTKIISGGGGSFGENSFALWDLQETAIAQMLEQLNREQIELLYKLYIASRINVPMHLEQNSESSDLFATLPQEIKELACELFRVQGAVCTESQAKRRKTE